MMSKADMPMSSTDTDTLRLITLGYNTSSMTKLFPLDYGQLRLYDCPEAAQPLIKCVNISPDDYTCNSALHRTS